MGYGVFHNDTTGKMPTALDRVQVLLQPDEYAELTLLAKEDRRSMAAMAAVLIDEAIRARKRAGTFVVSEDDPAYEQARNRQLERAGITPEMLKKVPKEFWEEAKKAKDEAEEAKASKTEELEKQMEEMKKALAALTKPD